MDQIPPSEDSKKGFIWVLADFALEEGVKSTTRYRKHNLKKPPKTEHPAPQRQASGARGGKAARKSASNKLNVADGPKRVSRIGRAPSSYSKSVSTADVSPYPALGRYNGAVYHPRPAYETDAIPNYMHTPSTTPRSVPEPRLFQYSDIVSCTDLSDIPLFCDDSVDFHEITTAFSQSFGSPSDGFLDPQINGTVS